MPDLVELVVNGRTYSRWSSASISTALETLAGGFQFEVSGSGVFPVAVNDAVQVRVAGETVITGWVDHVNVNYESGSHTVKIDGRERTGDLVDCSALSEPGHWTNVFATDIASDIASDYGIEVVTELGEQGAIFERFALQPGESAADAIHRACKLRGLLTMSDGLGRLVITRAGKGGRAAGGLREPGNLKSFSIDVNGADRFARYVVRGQRPGSDLATADECAQPEAEARDDGARSPRTLIIIADGAVDPSVAEERAAWEASVRLARGARLSCKVKGWRQTEGSGIWRPNLMVPTRINVFDLTVTLLLVGVRMDLASNGGSSTQLELAWPDAFLPEVVLTPKPEPTDFGSDLDEE